MKKVRARLRIEGVVQGVFYRVSAADAALKHNVCGWAKNNIDGTVEAVAEGDEDGVNDFINWCRIGPPRARVDNVEVKWEDYMGEFDDFKAITKHTVY